MVYSITGLKCSYRVKAYELESSCALTALYITH